MRRRGDGGTRRPGDKETGRQGDRETGGRGAKGFSAYTFPRLTLTRSSSGFTLFEVLLAIFILLVAIVPLLDAYRPSLLGTQTEEATIVFTNQARQTLNRAAALDFKTLSNNLGTPNLNTLFGAGQETAESFPFRGLTHVPTITISDASGGAGGLLEITVVVDRVTLKTLKADY